MDTNTNAAPIDYKSLLNPQQYEAVVNFYGPVLCLAGAGSGKTRTLVFRTAKMLESGILPESILLLTFTRKAAANMLSRVSALAGDRAKNITGGTYHSFAVSILRSYGRFIGLAPDFSIIDKSDTNEIIDYLRASSGLNKPGTSFPRAKIISDIFSKAVNLNMPVSDILYEYYDQYTECSAALTLLSEKYAQYKKKNEMLDYDDLLVFLLKLLEESADAKNAVNAHFTFIMADEYQDTNWLQDKITLLLGGNTQNIMVVGDDSQSIYSFRGARIKNIIDFPKSFENCRIIRLEQNYRSTASILDTANTIMNKATEGFKKKLYTDNETGVLPVVAQCSSEDDQADFIVKRVCELVREGVRLSDIAVLFRYASHTTLLEARLNARRIPYVKWGGSRFFDAKHLKDLVSYLRIVVNPFDQVAWIRAVRMLNDIGPQRAAAIYEHIKQTGKPYDLSGFSCSKTAKEGLGRLTRMLAAASEFVQCAPTRALEIITDYYFPIIKTRFEDYKQRFKDIDQLFIIAAKFANVPEFLTAMMLEPPSGAISGAITDSMPEKNDALILSTIHSAKGQEWNSVFVINALEGRFPTFGAAKIPSELEEERRLMYVAVTRASKNLYMSYPMLSWDQRCSGPLLNRSRFIEDLPQKLYENWQILRE